MEEVINGILIREVETKNIMTKSSLPVGGYSVNPYVGCTHACKYCYASFMKRFTGQQRRRHTQAQQHGRAPLPSFHRTSSGNRLFPIIYGFAPKVKPPSGRPHFVYNYSAISSWAICTALVAAPLRTWSPQHQMFSPLSLVRSSRIRPTNTRSWSLVSSGMG